MAVNKVVNRKTSSHGAMRNVIEYVLQDKKVKEGYVEITGPYDYDAITWDNIYRSFLDEKRIWDKDSGRMYAHNIISFHKDENITPAQALEIGQEFVDKFFPYHQNLIAVHQDKDHLHVHIVTNSVSFLDGSKLHQTKRDLQYQKNFTNKLCQERGLSITEKGKHFDGTAIEEGDITAWSKDKYNLLKNENKKSYVVECAIAVLETKEGCCSKKDFISGMEEKGWRTIWEDNKKHITFQNANGDKVRDNNLTKTFAMNISKGDLLREFERQDEIRRNRLKAERERELYYAGIESVLQRERITGSVYDEDIESGNGDTAALLRELNTKERAADQERRNREAERAHRDAERFRQDLERSRRSKKRSQSYDYER